jgi:uncharacterized protein YqgQ
MKEEGLVSKKEYKKSAEILKKDWRKTKKLTKYFFEYNVYNFDKFSRK